MKKALLFLLLIASFQFRLKAQLPNGGFENYVITSNDTLPVDWNSDSQWSTWTGRTTNAHSGTYAFSVNTWYSYAVGMLLNGNTTATPWFYNWIYAGTPISAKPARLKGFYMYTDTVNGDSAIAQVLLKKYNTAQNRIDTVAYGITKLPFASSYTSFQVDLNDVMPGVQPDSIVVFFMSYDYLKGTQFACQSWGCRYLYLDDLSLEGVLGIENANAEQSEISVYYNQNQLSIFSKKIKTETIEIYGADGRLVLLKNISNGVNNFDVSFLKNGIYFLRSKSGGSAVKWLKN